MLLALMAVLVSNAMVNAKLTIAYESAPNDKFDVNIQTVAKIRQAMIEIHGEDFFKDYIKRRFKAKWPLIMNYIGQDKELILQGRRLDDEDILLNLKSAYDLLSIRGDTLYFKWVLGNPNAIGDITGADLLQALDKNATDRLLVGRLFEKGVELNNFFYELLANSLEEEYEKECEEKGYLPYRMFGKVNFEDIRQEDIDFFFESLMKADKELLKQKITSKPIISKFSYEYDERAEVRYIHEKQLHIDELPR